MKKNLIFFEERESENMETLLTFPKVVCHQHPLAALRTVSNQKYLFLRKVFVDCIKNVLKTPDCLIQ